MAPIALSSGRFDIFNDPSTDDTSTPTQMSTQTSTLDGATQNRTSPLRPISVSSAQNRPVKSPTRVESLAAELKKLHLENSPEVYRYKGRPIDQVKFKGQPCAHSSRPPIRRDTFERLETVPEDEQRDAAPPEPEAASVSSETQHYIELPAHQFSNHPLASAARKLLSAEDQLAKHRKGDFEWVLAIRVPVDSSKPSSERSLLFGCNLLPSPSVGQFVTLLVTTLQGDQDPETETESEPEPEPAPIVTTPQKEDSPSSAMRESPSRIEDSVEALDKLEDQLEAFDQAANVQRIVAPKRSSNKGLASLQPPKPLAKSTKVPTVPTFELPGEAVARRLKEKREARLSMQATAEKAAAPAPSTSVRRTKSARAPTVPKFELPGEAISRRKREEREARLKAQEEEERKRREFKARPIRSGSMPAPRETITSRARQKGALPENVGIKSTTPSPSKQPLSHVSNQSQPRARPTSTSLGSLGSKRGSVPAEVQQQQQRLRGKDIYQRDNSYTQDREKERREREAMARIAREQAAEASRLRSREWAEKQRRKRMTVGSVRDLVG
ncbi:hypothetical protein PG989_012588 [Apiospora arundinis]